MKRNNDVMRSDRLKQVMQEIDTTFDEKNLGISKFSRFCQEAAQRGLLSVTKLDNGQLEVDLPGVSTTTATEARASRAEPASAAGDGTDAAAGADERPARRSRRGRGGRGRDREDRPPRATADVAAPSLPEAERPEPAQEPIQEPVAPTPAPRVEAAARAERSPEP